MDLKNLSEEESQIKRVIGERLRSLNSVQEEYWRNEFNQCQDPVYFYNNVFCHSNGVLLPRIPDGGPLARWMREEYAKSINQ